MNAFRLFVYAAVAMSILAIILHMFWVFTPQPDAENKIKDMLSIAEANLGKYNARNIVLQQHVMLRAEDFDSASRTVIFLCNDLTNCCQQSKSCSKPIEWDNAAMKRFVISKQSKEVTISTRCRFERLYICRIYVGQEPAQLAIESITLSPANKVLALGENATIEFTIKNSGRLPMSVVPKAKIYVEDTSASNGNWSFLKEFYGNYLTLKPGQSKSDAIQLFVNMPGHYKIEFLAVEENDETNFIQETFDIRVREKE